MHIDFAFGLVFKHKFYLKDVDFSVPIGFEYYKGYHYIITKKLVITPWSIEDPDWVVEKTSLNDIDNVAATSLAAKKASFKGSFIQEGYIKFFLQYSGHHTKIHIGYRIPYSLTVGFDDKKCLFPYLQGQLKIPLDLFFEFDGLDIYKWKVIKPTGEKVKTIFELNIGPFCIGVNSKIEEGSAIQGELPDAYTISTNGVNQIVAAGETKVEKSIIITVEDPSKPMSLSKLVLPFVKLESESYSYGQQMVAKDITPDAEIRWYLKYRDIGGGVISGSEFFSKKISDIKFDNNDISTIDIQIPKVDGSNKDVTKFQAVIQKSNLVNTDNVFTRTKKYVTAKLQDSNYNSKYNLYTIDKDKKPSIDDNAIFRSDCMANKDFETKGVYSQNKDSFDFILSKIQSAADIKRIDAIIEVSYGDKSTKTATLNTFSTPEIKTGATDATKLNLNAEFKAYIPSGTSLKVTGNVIFSDKTEKIESSFSDIKSGPIEITILKSPEVKLTYKVKDVIPLVTISSSKYPDVSQEVVAEVVNIPQSNWGTQNVMFDGDEAYKILHFTPVKGATKLFLSYAGGEISFLSPNSISISDCATVVILKGDETEVEVPIRCYETKDKNHEIKFAFCDLPAEKYRVNTDGVTALFNSNIPKVFIVPLVSNKYYIDSIAPDGFTSKEFSFNIDSDTIALFVERTSNDEASVTYYSTYTYLSDNNPVAKANLNYLKALLDKKKKTTYHVVTSQNGKKVMAISGDIELESKVSDGTAKFEITTPGEYSFSLICNDPSEEFCLISYPAPETKVHHLIKYPNRAGISTTGEGFLSEIITLEAGSGFDYYKTYKGAITKVKEYPDKKTKVTMKVEDTDKIEKFSKARKFCLYDEKDQVIPFSRKEFIENMDDLMDSIGVNLQNADLNYFYNDDDGCLITHGCYISKNEFKPSQKTVDLPLSEEIVVDSSKVSIEPGSVPPPTPVPDSSAKDDGPNLSVGGIVGIALGCFAGGCLITGVLTIVIQKLCCS